MSNQQYSQLKCGDLVADSRGIVFVITQRFFAGDDCWFSGVTLDNNAYHSMCMHRCACDQWTTIESI